MHSNTVALVTSSDKHFYYLCGKLSLTKVLLMVSVSSLFAIHYKLARHPQKAFDFCDNFAVKDTKATP